MGICDSPNNQQQTQQNVTTPVTNITGVNQTDVIATPNANQNATQSNSLLAGTQGTDAQDKTQSNNLVGNLLETNNTT